MRKLASLSISLLMAFVLVVPAVAGDMKTVTLEGEMQCAKCTMNEAGLDQCQNVLVVKKDGKEQLYYLAANETNHEYGDVCMNTRMVKVTGQLEEKEGRMWIAAAKIMDVKKG